MTVPSIGPETVALLQGVAETYVRTWAVDDPKLGERATRELLSHLKVAYLIGRMDEQHERP